MTREPTRPSGAARRSAADPAGAPQQTGARSLSWVAATDRRRSGIDSTPSTPRRHRDARRDRCHRWGRRSNARSPQHRPPRSAASTSQPPCIPKITSVKGHTEVDYCGPATATFKVGSKTYNFKDGYCGIDPKNKIAVQLALGVISRVRPPVNGGKPCSSWTALNAGGYFDRHRHRGLEREATRDGRNGQLEGLDSRRLAPSPRRASRAASAARGTVTASSSTCPDRLERSQPHRPEDPAGHHKASAPHTSSATSTTSRSFATCSS